MTAGEFRAEHARGKVELLHGLPDREIDLILATAKARRRSAKSVITHQGEPADHLYLLWTGRARYFFETSNGKKLILRWITPGDIFGGAALVSRPSTYLLSVEAVRDSVLLDWDSQTICELVRRFPRILENAIFLAADYISWYIAAHAALTSQTAEERLAHVLKELASTIGERVSGGVKIDVTNEELANSVNIAPHTTSRIMSAWQKAGVLRKSRGQLVLRSPEKLFVRLAATTPGASGRSPIPQSATNKTPVKKSSSDTWNQIRIAI
jgi:CRP/FNR family transcriptional regulator, nitrogen oxide reductase regulator